MGQKIFLKNGQSGHPCLLDLKEPSVFHHEYAISYGFFINAFYQLGSFFLLFVFLRVFSLVMKGYCIVSSAFSAFSPLYFTLIFRC